MPLHPPDMPAWLAHAPPATRVVAGVAGALLLVAGGRVYRLAIVLPGVLLGLGAGVAAGAVLGLAHPVAAGLAIGAAIVGGLVCHYLERLAIVIAGIIAGLAAANVAWPLVAAGTAPWYLWPLAAAAGAVGFPLLWRVALVPLTALLGALVVADAAGLRPDPLVIGGLAALGVVVQVVLGRKRTPREQ